MHPTTPFAIPAIRNFIPEKAKPWIIILYVIIYQLSGGIYLAAVSEIVGSQALLQEDIMMAGYASMVGMALTFTIMFRLKFRFPPKTTHLTCSTIIIIGNLITMYTHNVPLLVATCLITGIFRMWGTFECNSTIQLWITPKRDLSIFFCYIYLLVQGCIQLSGILTINTAYWANWQYMHWLIIGLLATIIFTTLILFRNYRSMPKLPLYGIDWLGAIMWALTILCIIFICVYGEHYDWFTSPHIKTATAAALIILALNLWRATFIRHPFIQISTLCYKTVYTTFALYIIVDILLAPSHLIEHLYTEHLLGYDILNNISLNWIVLFGTITGSLFSYFTFAKHKWRYKTMTLIAFISITAYLAYYYFTIDYNLPKESLILPLFLRSFGYVIIAICFITALSQVPFQNFFQALSVQAFVSAGFGAAFGTAILQHILKITVKKNTMNLSETLDRVNSTIIDTPIETLYTSVQQHALIVSMKELYGWLTIAGALCILLFMITESTLRPKYVFHPKYKSIRRFIKHQLRLRKKWEKSKKEIAAIETSD